MNHPKRRRRHPSLPLILALAAAVVLVAGVVVGMIGQPPGDYRITDVERYFSWVAAGLLCAALVVQALRPKPPAAPATTAATNPGPALRELPTVDRNALPPAQRRPSPNRRRTAALDTKPDLAAGNRRELPTARQASGVR